MQAKEEANESKLKQKNHLHKLILEWDVNRSIKDSTREQNVLESLTPHSNLQDICIRGHGGTNCPAWLGEKLSVESLESLCLDDVSWKNLPPLGELWLVNELGEEYQCCISGQSFKNLKRLELVKIPRLKKWVGNNGTGHLFSHLEVLIIKDCSEVKELPVSRSTCGQAQQGANMTWFPKLRELEIVDCPKLLTLPPIPWTNGPCSARIERAGSGIERLVYSELRLDIEGKDGQDSVFWNGLAFNNLTELNELEMRKCPPLPLDHLQMLASLKIMIIRDSSNVLSPVASESNTRYQFPVERIRIWGCGAGGKELTQLFSHFTKLTKLELRSCEKITVLGVAEQQTTETPASSSANKTDDAQIGEQQQQTRGGEEIAGGGLLLLPSQLQELEIWWSPELEILRTTEGGLQSLHSLRSLVIWGCPRFLSSYSFSSSFGFPFPISLQRLVLSRVGGMETLAPLSNLTSLTGLGIYGCGDLRGEGLWPLLAQGCLTTLEVYNTPKFFVGSEPSRPHEQEPLRPSSKLRELVTDDVAGVLAERIRSLLASSLTKLAFRSNNEVVRFTKEQEEALHLLSSLQDLQFGYCYKLQSLPAGLHRLDNLRILQISSCPAIRSLPKDGLPISLQEIEIEGCPAIRSLPKDGLPSSLQEIRISYCPAIRSLPKDSLPSSLRVLDVRSGNSEELRRQCRKFFTGAIPIIKA